MLQATAVPMTTYAPEFHAGHRAPLSREEAQRWVDELVDEFRAHPISSHPLMQNLADGVYPDPVFAITDFAHQVFSFARDFRAYLGMALSKLKGCPDVRENLLEHLREENGIYEEEELAAIEAQGVPREWIDRKPHVALYAGLLEKLGVVDQPFIAEADNLNRWMIDTIRLNSATMGTTMILGIELWASGMGEHALPALRKVGITPEDAIFFDLHEIVDTNDHISEIGADLVSQLTQQPPENSLDELKARLRAFQDERLRLWNVLHERAIQSGRRAQTAVIA